MHWRLADPQKRSKKNFPDLTDFWILKNFNIDLTQVANFGETNQLTCLCPCLDGVDPDEAFSSIPYEKGHMFLYHLEELLGGVEVFNKFLKDYIQNFKGMSIDTDDFKAFLYEYFNDKVFLNDIICLNT